MTATARGKLLYRLADLVAANAPALAELETRDTGKIIRETSAQIAYVADYYRYYAGLADKIEGASLPIDKPDMEVWLKREPVGVVAAIVPWNSQLFLAAVKIGPALAAGCTLVVKASEDGPAPLLEFARLVHEAGFPKASSTSSPDSAPHVAPRSRAIPKVAHIAFTGGPGTARHIVRNSAENLACTSLELGGKSPFIVFADADLESAANAQVAGIFAATGQSCVAGSRLIVEASIKDRFLEILKAKAEAIRIGAPLDMETEVGPLARNVSAHHIERVVAGSIACRSKARHRRKRASRWRRLLFRPTILDCDGIRSPSVETELFGPVLSVVSFETGGGGAALANDTPLWPRFRHLHAEPDPGASADEGESAPASSGSTPIGLSLPSRPSAAIGLSGHGREGGMAAALDYTRTKTVWLRTSDDPIPDPFVMR